MRERALRIVTSMLLIGSSFAAGGVAHAAAPFVTRELTFKASDGVVLHAIVGGVGSLKKRPLIVESSPYAPGCCTRLAGDAYNYVVLHWRGTGRSGGVLNSTGSKDQRDLSQFLGWACRQSWSDGRIGIYGFSASAIVAYNSMHLPLPCVKAAVLGSGTVDLYRDLLYIGGVPNAVPGFVVEAGIGGPWLANLPNNRQPETVPEGGLGYVTAPRDVNEHETYDAYWRERTFKGNRNKIPILAGNGFYDVESRGAFEGYKANRRYGAHLLVMGAHDGWPSTTAGPGKQYAKWFDRYVRGIRNGIEREPRVSLYLSKGSHRSFIDGSYARIDGTDWPLPKTRYTTYHLRPDKTLSATRPREEATHPYLFHPSNAGATDPHTTATVSGPMGDLEPLVTDLRTADPTSLTYTTAPFTKDVTMAGPASLDLFLASAAPVTDIVAVVADVWPDGSVHAVARGQLRTSFPKIDRSRTIVDKRTGQIVQPYNNFSTTDPAEPIETREYHVEILPIGNRFAIGHSLRLYLTGASFTTVGSAPGINLVSVGGKTPSRLVLPVI